MERIIPLGNVARLLPGSLFSFRALANRRNPRNHPSQLCGPCASHKSQTPVKSLHVNFYRRSNASGLLRAPETVAFETKPDSSRMVVVSKGVHDRVHNYRDG